MSVDQDLFYLPAIPDQFYENIPLEYDVTNMITIPAGEKVSALPSSVTGKAGFVRIASVSFNSPYGTLIINYDGKTITGNIKQVYEAGFTYPNVGFPYVTRYDQAGNNYVVAWEAERSFGRNISMYFANQSNLYNDSQDITIQGFIGDVYVWKQGFFEALAKVKQGETLKIYSPPD